MCKKETSNNMTSWWNKWNVNNNLPSTKFSPQTNLLLLSGKTHNIQSFVVQIYLRFLSLGFPFSSRIFNFPVNLLHFTSKLFTTHHEAYLSPPPHSKPFLYNPTVIFLPFFFLLLCWPTNLLHFSFFPHFPLQLFTHSCRLRSLLLIWLLPFLFPCPLWSLFAGPPSVALSGVSACEASALQHILLIGSILCIITPSCPWVQLAQSGPSVWSSAR